MTQLLGHFFIQQKTAEAVNCVWTVTTIITFGQVILLYHMCNSKYPNPQHYPRTVSYEDEETEEEELEGGGHDFLLIGSKCFPSSGLKFMSCFRRKSLIVYSNSLR